MVGTLSEAPSVKILGSIWRSDFNECSAYFGSRMWLNLQNETAARGDRLTEMKQNSRAIDKDEQLSLLLKNIAVISKKGKSER